MYGEEVDFNMEEQSTKKQPTLPVAETVVKKDTSAKKRGLEKKLEKNEVWAGPGGQNAWIFKNLTDDGKFHCFIFS